MNINIGGIPEDMKKEPRWVCWRQATKPDNNGRFRKLPIDPRTGKPFDKGSNWATDPIRWVSFDEAIACAQQPGVDGIGFVVGGGWAYVDRDLCIVDGKPTEEVIRLLIDELSSYSEVSPSTTGVKAIVRATGIPNKDLPDANGKVEIQTEGGFTTITGNHIEGTPTEVRDCTDQLEALIAGRPSYLYVLRLLQRFWPRSTGNRHELALAIGGYLGRHGFDKQAVESLVRHAAEHAKDDDVGDRVQAAGDSVDALADGGKVTGGKTVEEIIGADAWAVLHGYVARGKSLGRANNGECPLTELGDAEFFARKYSDTLRYDRLRGRWLRSDQVSGLWLSQHQEQVLTLAGEAMRERQHRALESNGDSRKRAIDWTIKGESRSRLNNMVALAQGIEPVTDDGQHWDENPWLLGCENGLVDLRTGEFRKGRPEDRVTMRVRVAFDPQATCPRWLETIDSVFATPQAPAGSGLLDQPDQSESMVDFMQRALGYSITGDCREECCFFNWGGGSNGKGTVMNTVGWLLGDYTDDMPYATLERHARSGGGIPSDVAKMNGKRFITCSEVNEFTINESRLKALTGRDPMTARFLHKDFFTFTPVGKIWIATNNKPKIVGTDEGIWRRINLIPFINTFDGATKNTKLKDLLREELPGILNWLIEGARLWLQRGLDPPETVKAATAAYRQESDGLSAFIDERCVVTGKVQGAAIWAAYQNWCIEAGVEDLFRLKQKAFFQALGKRFKSQTNRIGQNEYHGVGLLAAAGCTRDPGC